MLHFFRKIRRELLTESKFFRYLKYGIGEIILVVIGILIAIQVDNWNEERINHTRETAILKELRDDLLQTEDRFQNWIDGMEDIISSKKAIIKTIDENLIWNDTLQPHLNNFSWLVPIKISTSSYLTLQDWGLSNISNESLRRDITYIFEDQVRYCDLLYESLWLMHERASWQDDISALFDLSDLKDVSIRDYGRFLKSTDYSFREKA